MLAFTNALLIDGSGAGASENANVILEGKTILDAGKGIPIPDGAQIIDLKGKTLAPGFSDVHTHLGGGIDIEHPGLTGRFGSCDYAKNRESALNWGVTALRSAGDFMPDITAYRDAVNAGEIRSPRIFACGRMLQARGGHPASTVYFDDEAVISNACVLIDEASDIEAAVSALAADGADWIKTFVTDKNAMDRTKTMPKLDKAQLRRIAAAAHKCGKPVMMHVDDVNDLDDAIESGADTIEHIVNFGTLARGTEDALLKKLTAGDIWVVPTMTVKKMHDDGASPVWEGLLATVRRMIEAGVKLGVGCDSGIPFIPYGECVHMEMEFLTQAGYSPLQAITAATGGNAALLRADRLFGRIAPGLAADLVVLGSNPLEDIRNTRDIKMVLRDGAVVVDRMLSGGQETAPR